MGGGGAIHDLYARRGIQATFGTEDRAKKFARGVLHPDRPLRVVSSCLPGITLVGLICLPNYEQALENKPPLTTPNDVFHHKFHHTMDDGDNGTPPLSYESTGPPAERRPPLWRRRKWSRNRSFSLDHLASFGRRVGGSPFDVRYQDPARDESDSPPGAMPAAAAAAAADPGRRPLPSRSLSCNLLGGRGGSWPPGSPPSPCSARCDSWSASTATATR